MPHLVATMPKKHRTSDVVFYIEPTRRIAGLDIPQFGCTNDICCGKHTQSVSLTFVLNLLIYIWKTLCVLKKS